MDENAANGKPRVTPICTIELKDKREPVRIEQPIAVMQIRSFVRPHDDHFFACCVDLNVAAEASTPEEAKLKLSEAICSYLTTVVKRDGLSAFRHRPAPLSVKLEYWYWRIIGRRLMFNSKNNRSSTPMVITEPIAMEGA